MRRLRIAAEGWAPMTVTHATTFLDRLAGIRRRGGTEGVLIETSSVHSIGFRRPLRLVGLDEQMRVVSVRELAPNRVAVMRGARHILELSVGAPVPSVGALIEVLDA